MRILFYIVLVFVTISQVFSQSKFDLGLQAMAQENWNAAIEMFEEDRDSLYAVESDYNIGVCYIGLADFNSALYFFEKSLKTSPSENRMIDNASLSFKKLYPEESWSHPYSGFKRMILSLSSSVWVLISLLCVTLLAGVVYSLVLGDTLKKYRNVVLLVIGTPLWLFSIYGVFETYGHSRELHFLIPKNSEVTTFLTVEGIEAEEKLQIGKRYKIITEAQSDWVRFQGNSSLSLWVRKSDVNIY